MPAPVEENFLSNFLMRLRYVIVEGLAPVQGLERSIVVRGGEFEPCSSQQLEKPSLPSSESTPD